MLKGIDISSYQGNPDFDTLKDNIDFIIIKASEGIGWIDPKFSRNQKEVRRVGLPLGYYHFARPDYPGNTPEAEAEWFMKVISPPLVGEMLFLDFEIGYAKAVTWCKTFLDTINEKLGYKPLIYLNQSQVNSFDWSPVIDADYGLWLAAYLDYCPDTPWPVVAFQQNSSKGSVKGVVGNVDTNLFFGDEETLTAYGLKGGEEMDCTKCTYSYLDPEDKKFKIWTGSRFASEWATEKQWRLDHQKDNRSIKDLVTKLVALLKGK